MESAYLLKDTLYLVGFMGAGKTSVSRHLARIVGTASIDLDSYISRFASMSIRHIFDNYGEEAFRTLETQALTDIDIGMPAVISCGGGIVEKQENRAFLKNHGVTIFLNASLRHLDERITNKESRPLFQDFDKAQKLYERRLPYYKEVADLTVNTDFRGSKRVAWEVVDSLCERGIITVEK